MADYLDLARAEVRRLNAAAARAPDGTSVKLAEIAVSGLAQTTQAAAPSDPRQIAFDDPNGPGLPVYQWEDSDKGAAAAQAPSQPGAKPPKTTGAAASPDPRQLAFDDESGPGLPVYDWRDFK